MEIVCYSETVLANPGPKNAKKNIQFFILVLQAQGLQKLETSKSLIFLLIKIK